MIRSRLRSPDTSAKLSVLVKHDCATCGKQFVKHRMGQKVCGPKCAVKLVRDDTKKRKEALKTNTAHARAPQASINRYVNLRDAGKPCISCGKPDRGVRNASHYKSRGSNSALRFHLWNIHSACYRCNCELSGNIAGYRIGLEERHPGRVEWLDNHPRSREYTPEYCKRFTRVFNKKSRRLERRRALNEGTK